MIAELSAAMAAIKETAGLIKVISDAKTDAEVKAATIELQSKLLTLQTECFSLGDVIRQREEETMLLKEKVTEYEDFRSQVEGYVLNQLDSGTYVYSKDEEVNGRQLTVHLCTHCFSKHIKSILHFLPVHKSAVYHSSRCLHCKNEFLMDKNSGYVAPPSMAQIGRMLND